MSMLRCDHGPEELLRVVACLDEISKDLEGEIVPLDAEVEECRRPDCTSLTTLHAIKAEVRAHACDGKLAGVLDGVLVVERLTTIFADGDAMRRGVHAGDFVWRGSGRGLLIRGRLQGITNAGISRSPLRVACEECHNPGAMVGRLCGTVVRSLTRPDLVGALVTAVYRFEVDPTERGGEGRLAGVVEGALVQECGGEPQCVDFATVVAGSNPLVDQGHRFEVFDHAGAPQPQTEIVTWGASTGLHLWFRTTIDLATPADAVRLTIARFATAGTVTAFDGSGSQVAQVPITGPQGVGIAVGVAAPGITRLEVVCPSDEHLLLELCVDA